jgi:hypothetical protein
VANDREHEVVAQLYEELKKFAPADTAVEMSRLAARLSDIADREAEVSQSPDKLGEVWDRVERYLRDHPHHVGDDSAPNGRSENI